MPEIWNNRYVRGKKLGEGAFAKVYKVIDQKTKEERAIKKIDKELLQEDGMDEQMKREIAIQRMLEHENCVRLYEVFETERHIFLVLELVRGGELFDRLIEAVRFEEDVARCYFQQFMLGLHYCHHQGVAHRDLKPENLLLDEKNTLKITDFGLANFQNMATGKASKSMELLQTTCGTPNYMAPEVLKEEGYNGFAADIWTAGVILFVMAAGYLPFDDDSDNLNVLFRMIERGDYHMERSFSRPLQDLIRKMLVVDASMRIGIEDIMRHPWFLPGFDSTQLDAFRGSTKIQPSKAQIANSVTKGASDGENKEVAAALPTLNALQIISELTGSHLSALIQGGTHGVQPPSSRAFLKTSHEEARAEVRKALEKSKIQIDAGKTPTELKCFGKVKGPPVQFSVIVSPTVCSRLSICTLRKLKGDTLSFQEVYRAMTKGLGELVANPPPPKAKE
eukprot:Hpha_TRINITY_DN3293_c0_g1::TRINITY_DN3293_c0_g1_i1::g.185828::m.185828